MKNLRIFLILLSLLAQPLFGSEKSSLYTVDMGKLFRSSDFGKKIIYTNNISRQELQNENEKLESVWSYRGLDTIILNLFFEGNKHEPSK